MSDVLKRAVGREETEKKRDCHCHYHCDCKMWRRSISKAHLFVCLFVCLLVFSNKLKRRIFMKRKGIFQRNCYWIDLLIGSIKFDYQPNAKRVLIVSTSELKRMSPDENICWLIRTQFTDWQLLIALTHQFVFHFHILSSGDCAKSQRHAREFLTRYSISRLPAELIFEPRNISLQILIFGVSERWQSFGGFGTLQKTSFTTSVWSATHPIPSHPTSSFRTKKPQDLKIYLLNLLNTKSINTRWASLSPTHSLPLTANNIFTVFTPNTDTLQSFHNHNYNFYQYSSKMIDSYSNVQMITFSSIFDSRMSRM
jgi:hypothetical protein